MQVTCLKAGKCQFTFSCRGYDSFSPQNFETSFPLATVVLLGYFFGGEGAGEGHLNLPISFSFTCEYCCALQNVGLMHSGKVTPCKVYMLSRGGEGMGVCFPLGSCLRKVEYYKATL